MPHRVINCVAEFAGKGRIRHDSSCETADPLCCHRSQEFDIDRDCRSRRLQECARGRLFAGTVHGRQEMEFNIRPVAKACAKSGTVFRPGDRCWSVLFEKDGQLVRQDICEAEWNGPPQGAIGHWQCRVPETSGPVKQKFDADSLFSYFVQLCESPNVVQQQYRYVLALLLLRKRRLILEAVTDVDDRPVMHLIGSAGEGPFDVPEEELSEEQIERLQFQLFDSGRAVAA